MLFTDGFDETAIVKIARRIDHDKLLLKRPSTGVTRRKTFGGTQKTPLKSILKRKSVAHVQFAVPSTSTSSSNQPVATQPSTPTTQSILVRHNYTPPLQSSTSNGTTKFQSKNMIQPNQN